MDNNYPLEYPGNLLESEPVGTLAVAVLERTAEPVPLVAGIPGLAVEQLAVGTEAADTLVVPAVLEFVVAFA